MRTIRFVPLLVVALLLFPALSQGASAARPKDPQVFYGTVRVTEFPVPTSGSRPYQIVTGPDGNLWFTESYAGSIGKITPTGAITEYKIRTGSGPYGITVGPDGNLWFTERFANMIAKFSVTQGKLLAEYPVLTDNSQPWGITTGPDGALWFTEEDVDQIGRITVDGEVGEFPTQNCCFPTFITTGGDGGLWFTEEIANQLGRMNTDGSVQYVTPPTAQLLYGITTAPDGKVWFTALSGTNELGMVDANMQVKEFTTPSNGTGIAGVTVRPQDGNVYFTQNDIGRVASMTPTGDRIILWMDGSFPFGITTGPDGNIWIAEGLSDAIGRLTVRP